MALLNILIFPDQRLRTVASEVVHIDNSIKTLTSDLLETMYKGNGIGLSATQVNIHKRIMVIDVSEEKDSPLVLINPIIKIVDPEEQPYNEGCLSVPGFYEEVERPKEIEVTALSLEGKKFSLNASGILSVAIQHEMDHLDGKIFVDFLSVLKRERIKKKLKKVLRSQG